MFLASRTPAHPSSFFRAMDDRVRLLPETKQQKAWRSVRLKRPPDVGRNSRLCDINHFTVSYCNERPISGVARGRGEMLPLSAT